MSVRLPDTVIAYRRTPIFDQDSVPAGLLRRHDTKPGVWGLIVVLDGQLRLRFHEPVSERILDPQSPGVIAPQQPHDVEPIGAVNFFVEFYGDPKTVGPIADPTAPSERKAHGTGFADPEEIVAALNELLEAERAGARVTLETARASRDPAIAALMRHIQQDEARWCAMLLRRIRSLDGIASPRMGTFYGKAMAIEDVAARISFLNRGQGWVVRKLRELIPRIGDAALYADLSHMLSSHVANITLANSAGTGTPAAGAP